MKVGIIQPTFSDLISKMLDGSKYVVGEANQNSKLYSFSQFVPKFDNVILLTYANEERILWLKNFVNFHFSYLY
jgi:hypothetical protein